MTYSPEQSRFIEFARLKTQVGGPDVHMRTAIQLVSRRTLSFSEEAWWLGVYTTFCSVSPGLRVWLAWPEPGTTLTDMFRTWLLTNYAAGGLPVRTQRRPVRSGAKLATCIQSMARWHLDVVQKLLGMDYEEAWASVDEQVKYYGRYAIIKFLEALRRRGMTQLEAPDIRPRGAWSPRKALGYLYPRAWDVLTSKSDSRPVLAEVNAVAADALALLEHGLERPSSYYELEVLLCNFRQATYSGTLYVGRTIDSELEYYHRVRACPPDDPREVDVLAARAQIFPVKCLGEKMGWEGVRKELKVYRGYYWSDVLYDWGRTTDFDHPVRWEDSR